MRTISQRVEQIIGKSPFLAEALAEDLVNISSVARKIRKQVEQSSMRKVSLEAVSMALRRLSRRLRPQPLGLRFLKELKNVTVRSNLIEYVFPNTPDLLAIYKQTLGAWQSRSDSFFNISRGMLESIVVVSAELDQEVQKILRKQKGKLRVDDLASVTLKLPRETISTPGVYYPIMKALAWEGVNVIEVISIGSELSILFKSSDIDRAFSVIQRLVQ